MMRAWLPPSLGSSAAPVELEAPAAEPDAPPAVPTMKSDTAFPLMTKSADSHVVGGLGARDVARMEVLLVQPLWYASKKASTQFPWSGPLCRMNAFVAKNGRLMKSIAPTMQESVVNGGEPGGGSSVPMQEEPSVPKLHPCVHS